MQRRDVDKLRLHVQELELCLTAVREETSGTTRERARASELLATLHGEVERLSARVSATAGSAREAAEHDLQRALAEIKQEVQVRMASSTASLEASFGQMRHALGASEDRLSASEKRLGEVATAVARMQAASRAVEQMSSTLSSVAFSGISPALATAPVSQPQSRSVSASVTQPPLQSKPSMSTPASIQPSGQPAAVAAAEPKTVASQLSPTESDGSAPPVFSFGSMVRPPRLPAEGDRHGPEPSMGELSQSELHVSALHAPSPGEVLADTSISAVLATTPSRVTGAVGEETGIAPSTLGFQGSMPEGGEDDGNNSWDEDYDFQGLKSDDGLVPLPSEPELPHLAAANSSPATPATPQKATAVPETSEVASPQQTVPVPVIAPPPQSPQHAELDAMAPELTPASQDENHPGRTDMTTSLAVDSVSEIAEAVGCQASEVAGYPLSVDQTSVAGPPPPPAALRSGTGSVDTATAMDIAAEFDAGSSPSAAGAANLHPDAELPLSDWDASGSFDGGAAMSAAATAAAAAIISPSGGATASASSAPQVGLRASAVQGTGSLDLDASGSDWDASGSLELPGGSITPTASVPPASTSSRGPSAARFGLASQLDVLQEEEPALVATTAAASTQPGSKAKAAMAVGIPVSAPKAPPKASATAGHTDSARSAMADLGFDSDDPGLDDEDDEEDAQAASCSWDR